MDANELQSAAHVSTGSGAAARMKKNVTDKAQDAKQSTAKALAWTATSLHSQTEKMSKLAHSVADRIQVGADYLRERDVERIMEDVRGLVRKYPGRSLAAAAILGFLIARGVRR